MKTIIIATDFSPAAKNAADYAAQLSKITESKIILFHSWSFPVMTAESLAVNLPLEKLEEESMARLKKEAARIEKSWGIKPEHILKSGMAADELLVCAAENDVALVIMGMEHRNKLGQILGSVATAFLHQEQFPALIIPQEVAFAQPRTFLFATDLHSKTDWQEFDLLAEVASSLHAEIHILNAVPEGNLSNANESRLGIKLEARLKKLPHTWHFSTDSDVVHAIKKKAKEISADWIAVVPHKYSWMKQLFHHSISSEITFNSNCPILALPEKKLSVLK